MNYFKLYISIIAFSCDVICYAQTYFHSIGLNHEFNIANNDVTDIVDESLIEESGTIPYVALPVQDTRTVSMPLKKLHITSPFGNRRDPLSKKIRQMHNGIDLKAKFEPVMAMLPGTVFDTGYSKTGGYYVILSHGICLCTYLHLSKIVVRNGSHVSAGEIVAISGASGTRCTGPHLHLSVRYYDGQNKGKYFNPMLLMEFVADKMKVFLDRKREENP